MCGYVCVTLCRLRLYFGSGASIFQNQCSRQIASLSASRVLVFGSLGRDGVLRGSDSDRVESEDASEKQLSRDRLCRVGDAKPTACTGHGRRVVVMSSVLLVVAVVCRLLSEGGCC